VNKEAKPPPNFFAVEPRLVSAAIMCCIERDWFYCVATENARPDIARLDNSAPYRKGGHRELVSLCE